jgi:hypothetical protein
MNTSIFCERKGKDFNNITKRCLKKCNAGEKRDKKTFKCKKLKKTKRICEQENKDFNDFTLKCFKKCKPDYERDKYFTCKKTKKNQLLCDNENKDFNPFSKRCVKKCAENQERDLNFKCRKIKIPEPATENPSINKKDATELIKFITLLEEKGSEYEESGIHYESTSLLESILYEYLIEKYNTNCFLYGYSNYGLKPLYINIYKYGLLGNANYLSKYQKYVYKMIKLIMNCIQKIQNTEQEVLIIPLHILYEDTNGPSAHANMLIYRKSLNVLEHYEPHGKQIETYHKSHINLSIIKIIKIIVDKMNARNKENKYAFYKSKIKYIPPKNTCIYNKGLQLIEGELFLSEKIKKIENGGAGLCAIWSTFFAELTLMNPFLTTSEILDNVINCVDMNACVQKSQKTKNVIRGYLDYVYNKINPIVKKLIGKNIKNIQEENLSEKIINTVSSDVFEKIHNNYMRQKFKKYNKYDMKKYFEEPEEGDVFIELTPENVNPKYIR